MANETLADGEQTDLTIPICSMCGQGIRREIKPMYWSSDLVYRTVGGHINARCPDCKYNMRSKKVKGGRVYECTRCHQWWRLET
jgi:hypothetical protein